MPFLSEAEEFLKSGLSDVFNLCTLLFVQELEGFEYDDKPCIHVGSNPFFDFKLQLFYVGGQNTADI